MRQNIIFLMLIFWPLLGGASEKIDPQLPAKANIMIPAPGEVILQGRRYKVFPDVSIVRGLLEVKYSRDAQERSAIYLGRTLAVVLLSLDKFDGRTLGKYLLKIKEALLVLEVPSRHIDRFDAARSQVSQSQWSRTMLIRNLDVAYAELAAQVDYEQNKNILYRIVQGSAWLQGQNLMAIAIKKQKKYDIAKTLLSHPQITKFILGNLHEAKQSGKSSSIIDPLVESMQKYQQAMTPEHLGIKEVDVIITETERFLTQL